jgi:hypothetical protein
MTKTNKIDMTLFVKSEIPVCSFKNKLNDSIAKSTKETYKAIIMSPIVSVDFI